MKGWIFASIYLAGLGVILWEVLTSGRTWPRKLAWVLIALVPLLGPIVYVAATSRSRSGADAAKPD